MCTKREFVLAALVAIASASGCGSSGGGGGDATPPADMVMLPDLSTLDPGVISTSSKSQAEAETHVAIAPNGYLAVAYIGITQTGSNNGYRFSMDQGDTFLGATALDAAQAGRETSDPVLAADAMSNFYLTWVEFQRDNTGQPFDMHVYAARAPVGTTTFTDVAEVTSNPQGADFYDKPWITVLNDGAIMVTYARTSTGGIFAARSTDFSTWSRATIVEDGGFRNLVFPCQPASAMRVYATYHAGGGIGLRFSDDGGMTWPDANKTAVAAMSEGQPAFDDPTCAADGMDVWVTYGLSNDMGLGAGTTSPNLFAIRLAHSGDGGVTIDNRYDAHDATAASLYMHPYLLREPTGALDLTYYAGNNEGDTQGSFRFARSLDGGKTWPASTKVKTMVYTNRRDTAQWVGDYSGLAWLGGELYMSYANNTGAAVHTAFYRTAEPGM